jgi:hypothetical protein
MATIKKAQNGAKTADSTAYFSKKADSLARSMKKKNLKGDFKGGSKDLKGALGALKDEYRQGNKGQSGYDKNGYPVKKKMRNGGSLTGLKASNKRVGPIDPKGAFTKVQKKTLAGAKGKASLTKDKQLGATKMAKRGMSIKKK